MVFFYSLFEEWGCFIYNTLKQNVINFELFPKKCLMHSTSTEPFIDPTVHSFPRKYKLRKVKNVQSAEKGISRLSRGLPVITPRNFILKLRPLRAVIWASKCLTRGYPSSWCLAAGLGSDWWWLFIARFEIIWSEIAPRFNWLRSNSLKGYDRA